VTDDAVEIDRLLVESMKVSGRFGPVDLMRFRRSKHQTAGERERPPAELEMSFFDRNRRHQANDSGPNFPAAL